MKKPTTLLLLVAVATSLFAQADKSQYLYTRDKKLIGNKNELVRECAAEMDEEGMTEANKTEICECVLQQMANHLTFKEFNKMVEDDDFDFEKIFEDKKHKDMANGVLQCVFAMMQNGGPSSFRDEFLNECIKGFEEEGGSLLDGVDATRYCNCMLDKIIENAALANNFMEQADDENSPLIAEAALPCMLEAMSDNEDKDKENADGEDSVIVRVIDPITLEEIVTKEPAPPKEKSPDVSGDILSVEIPLTRYGSTYSVKVKIGSVEERFILDSGASDVLINKEFEKKLLSAGIISKADELGERVYALADGRKVKAKVYMLNGLMVGGFTVNNVMAGVISDDASLLLGKSFLDKFSQWRIDNEKKTLFLEK